MNAQLSSTVQYKNNGRAAFAVAVFLSLWSCTDVSARTITVTNTFDSGKGSFRDALLLANESGDTSVIEFCLKKKDPGYDACTHSWCIKPCSALPVITVPLTIDGYTQRGALTNSNQADQPDNACIKIELCGPGLNSSDPLDDLRGLLFGPGSDGSQVKGLAIGDFPVGVEIQSNNSCVRGCFLGVGVDGTTPKHNTISVLVACGADGTCIGTEKPCDRNVIGGLGYKRIAGSSPKYPCPVHEESGAVTILGSTNTTVQQTTVGLTAQGDTPIATPPTLPTPPVMGIALVETTGTTIGTPAPDPVPVQQPAPPVPSPVPATVVIPTFTVAAFPTNVGVEGTTSFAVFSSVQSGTDILGNSMQVQTPLSAFSFAGVFGRSATGKAAVVDESQNTILITDSLFSGASESGILIGRAGEQPMANVKIVRTRIGTDRTGMVPVPNGKHGIHIANAVNATVNETLVHFNGEHGVFLEQSVRTNINNSSLSFNGKDGINLNAASAKSDDQPKPLTIVGAQANDCTCVCSDTCCCFKLDGNGVRICC